MDTTFKAVAMDWLDEQTNNPTHVLAEQTFKNTEFFFKPIIKRVCRHATINTISNSPQVLRLLKQVQNAYSKRQPSSGIASRIFAHAVISGLIEHNPVTAVKEARALKPTRQKHHPAIIDPQEFSLPLKRNRQLAR